MTVASENDVYRCSTAITGSWAGPFGYAGKFGYQSPSIPGVTTPDEGITLMGHRYYDSSTGRFLTRDPIFDGRNWYSYGGGEGNPLTGADPTGLAKIYVYWRQVARVGHHVYLIIVDENTGQSWTVGGGPQNTGSASGNLINMSGPAGEHNYESLRPGKVPPGAVLIRDDDLDGSFWFDKTHNIGEEIESEEHDYFFLTTNSNSFLYTVLKRAGLMDEWTSSGSSSAVSGNSSTMVWGGSVWAPGWGIALERRRR